MSSQQVSVNPCLAQKLPGSNASEIAGQPVRSDCFPGFSLKFAGGDSVYLRSISRVDPAAILGLSSQLTNDAVVVLADAATLRALAVACNAMAEHLDGKGGAE